MKKKSFLWMLGMLFVMTAGFSGCSSDDDEGVGNSSLLLGTWEITHIKGYDTWNGTTESWDEDVDATNSDDYYGRVEFLENGILNHYSYINGSWKKEEGINYRVDGNKIYVTDEYDESEPSTIVTLTADKLVIEDSEEYDGNKYWEQITYKRVK